MEQVTVEDVEEMLETLEGIATHSGIWLDSYEQVTVSVRDSILRAMTVAANGVRRGRAMLHDGVRIIAILEEVKGFATDAAEILRNGPVYVADLYRGVAYLCHVMWKRCQEQGVEQ